MISAAILARGPDERLELLQGVDKNKGTMLHNVPLYHITSSPPSRTLRLYLPQLLLLST